jgi:hypothetical protein
MIHVSSVEGEPMKIFRWVLVFLLVLGTAPSHLSAQDAKSAAKPLTNQDVVDLVKTGLSTEIIAAKIRVSPSQFDTSASALKALKESGVPDAVILAMVDPASKPAAPAATDAPKSEASSSDSAHVRVYRPRLLPGSGFNPSIYVDDKEVFRLVNARRCSVRISPGPHTISSDDKSSRIQVDAKPGQEFYISVQELPGGFLKGRGKLTLIANEQGKPEYQLEKPLDDDKKVARDMIEEDPIAEMPPPAGVQPAAK